MNVVDTAGTQEMCKVTPSIQCTRRWCSEQKHSLSASECQRWVTSHSKLLSSSPSSKRGESPPTLRGKPGRATMSRPMRARRAPKPRLVCARAVIQSLESSVAHRIVRFRSNSRRRLPVRCSLRSPTAQSLAPCFLACLRACVCATPQRRNPC